MLALPSTTGEGLR
jgi:hypothetical protein